MAGLSAAVNMRRRAQRGFIHVDIRRYYFDTPLVQEFMRKMQRDAKNYRHYAGYLRRVARNSIKHTRAKPGSKAWAKPSKPGTPPRSRDMPQKRMKKIEFGWDTREDVMLVGSIRFPTRHPVGGIHEKGKTVSFTRNVYAPRRGRAHSRLQAKAYKRKLRDGSIRPRDKTGTSTIIARYPKREFMWPAAKKTKDKFPQMWATAARRG